MNHKDYGRYEMNAEKTRDKGAKAKSTDFEFPPVSQRMFEMMSKCCTGRGDLPDCSVMMKSMMETAKKQPCRSQKKEDAASDRRKK